MNERIKQLALECYNPYTEFDHEKFAVLIIKECAEQVDWILAEGGKTQGDLIKQHFGVEE